MCHIYTINHYPIDFHLSTRRLVYVNEDKKKSGFFDIRMYNFMYNF